MYRILTILFLGAMPLLFGVEKSQAVSDDLDRLVLNKLQEKGLQPQEMAEDSVFLRRIYLDLAGRIPTYQEATDFLSSKNPNKRNALIDELIDSEAYVSHNFNYWADTLRATSRMRFGTGDNYIDFIKDAIRQNKPYDKFVHEMLASNGKLHEHANGATGYYLRDAGMPLDNMANTMQIFLGTSMVCAQCHDHPFDRWTQMDFYKLAAFTSGLRVNRYGNEKKDPRFQYYRKVDRTNVQLRRLTQNFTEALFGNVSHSGTGLIRLPHDYDYDDAKPFEVIKAGVPYGQDVEIDNPDYSKEVNRKLKTTKNGKKKVVTPGREINSRQTFADWVTSKENPMFTKTIVNRMWDKYMGAPLIGEVLNITPKADGVNRPLTDMLVEAMKKVDYDLKEFTRIIVKSKTYQRQVIQDDLKDKNYFSGPLLKRLTAEQLWDSLLSLGVENPDLKLPGKSTKGRQTLLHEKLVDLNVDEYAELITTANEKGKKFIKNMMSSNDAGMGMMAMTTQMASANNKYKSDKKALIEVRSQMKKAGKVKDGQKLADLRAQSKLIEQKMKQDVLKMRSLRNSSRREFTRASEVSSPAPASHFLRRFGQSERLLIDGAVDEASVPQALTLLNGKVEDYITNNPYSYINLNMAKAETNQQKIEVAYLSILSRLPDVDEKNMFMSCFERNSEQALKDIVWVLINSNEFMFKN